MSSAIALTTGIAIALIVGGVWIAMLLRRRARFETAEGLAILSQMRWRELSNLVVDALASSGFERETAEQRADRGMQGDVHVYRDGQPWVLTCRQGLAHRVTPASVEEFLRQLRTSHAFGGLIVTPGRVDPAARHAASNVELVDGDELWRLVGPLLPSSVHGEISMRARARFYRSAGLAIASATGIALALGLALSWLMPSAPADDEPASTPTVSRPRRAATAPTTPAPAAPMSEDEEREAIVHEMAALPGVQRTLWSTRSTLQVYLSDPTVATDPALCSVMKRHELLRASRLQIEPPEGSDTRVRFMQCAVY